MKQGNNVIKTFLDGISDDDINYTLDKFWNDSIGFHLKNCPFYGDDFIWRRKYIQDRNSHLWHQKYSLPFTKVLSIVACRVKLNILGIGTAERSWGDVKMNKYVKKLLLSVMYHRNITLFIHLPIDGNFPFPIITK